MANILLTTKCTRSCPYCFAGKEMASTGKEVMSWENLIYLTDFLQASGERNVSLLGGEPTLHQNFIDFVLYLIERNFDVCVFSNGIMSQERLNEIRDHLTVISPVRLTFVCNLNNTEQTPALEEEALKVRNFLSVMGPWTQPGFNIYHMDFEVKFIFDLVNRYGMKRALRLGITHPVPGMNSVYIQSENIGEIIDRLYSYRPLFDRFRIKPGLDCGFPLCQLNDEQLGWFQRSSRNAQFGCGPAIDISPDMSVYCCFPLSTFYRKSIFEFDNLKQVSDYYMHLQEQIRIELPGIYDECDGCTHREDGACSGGGACQLLNRFTDEAPIRILEIENELPKNCMPIQHNPA